MAYRLQKKHIDGRWIKISESTSLELISSDLVFVARQHPNVEFQIIPLKVESNNELPTVKCPCGGELTGFALKNPDTADYLKNDGYQCNACQKCYILAGIEFLE